ncbi:MAG: LysR family transcriptional regulator [Alphaproteobacteria bacterium]|nr:LysR family transcriptional regulator [Alphaproteobacteria bacterium]
MESRYVRHFVAACDHGTFAAAAAALGLTQQAVSKSILRLESTLGVRLFERDGRRLRPTAYAELFLPHARAIAAETDRFRTGLDDMLGGRSGTLRIGVGPSAAVDLVSEAVARLLDRHPGVRVKVEAGLFDDMSDALVLGRLDLFVAIRQIDRPAPLLSQHPLRDIRYIVVAGPGHPLAQRGDATLADLAAADWISGTALGDIDARIAAAFDAAGLPRPPATIETTSVLFALSLLTAGRHVMVLPETLAADGIAAGRLAPIRVTDAPPWTRSLVVVLRRRAARVPVISEFVAILGAGENRL